MECDAHSASVYTIYPKKLCALLAALFCLFVRQNTICMNVVVFVFAFVFTCEWMRYHGILAKGDVSTYSSSTHTNSISTVSHWVQRVFCLTQRIPHHRTRQPYHHFNTTPNTDIRLYYFEFDTENITFKYNCIDSSALHHYALRTVRHHRIHNTIPYPLMLKFMIRA